MTPQLIRRLAWLAASFGVAALMVGGWQLIVNQGLVSRVFLPGPDQAWAALRRGWTVGDLQPRLMATLERMTLGWLLASIIGIGLGAIIGSSAKIRAWLGPTLEFLRPLPASAIIPVCIALLGLTDTMVLTVIAFGAVWPVLLATIHGFSAVEARLYEVGHLLKMSRLTMAWKIALPSASPDILAGIRLGLTVSLILTIVCEMMAGRSGLGQTLLLAARSFRAPDLFAGVILVAIVGFVSATLISLVEARILRWRKRAG